MSGSKLEELLRVRAVAPDPPPAAEEPFEEGEVVDDPIKPWAFVTGGRSVSGIDFAWENGAKEGFEYACLTRRRYEPGLITLRFSGDDIEEVSIQGRSLDELWNLIRDRKCFRVRVTPAERDFRHNGAAMPIVTHVRIRRKEEEGEGPRE